MKVVALVSGGKDSCYAMMKCIQYGHQIVALANLMPASESVDELDSYMYQTVGHQMVACYAQCMGLPLFRRQIRGSPRNGELNYQQTSGDEVEDLFVLLDQVKRQIPSVEAVSSGAIASDYQRLRVESICSRLGLVSLAYLWKQDQTLLLQEMITNGIGAILVKVASMGLDPAKHLGKDIASMESHLLKLKELYGVNVCGEGGEYETLTLDCPLFVNSRIVLDKFQIILHSSDAIAPVGVIHPLKFHLEKKETSNSSGPHNENNDVFSDHIGSVFEVQGDSPSIDTACRNIAETADITENTHGGLCTSMTKKNDMFSMCCWLENSHKSSTGLQEDLNLVLNHIESRLLKHGYRWEHVLYIHLYISSMDEFATANQTYIRFITQEKCPFGVPSRSTIELPLSQAGIGRAYVEFLVTNNKSKNVLHVQSISSWAPSCIGPYSQATLHNGILHMAGQLGLDPSTMSLSGLAPAAELEQTLKNSEAVANCFKCSISTSAILFTIYCSQHTPSRGRHEIQDKQESFLDQLRQLQPKNFSKCQIIEPMFLYVLVPDLPKRALVEVKPLLFVPNDVEIIAGSSKPPSHMVSDCWDFQPADWHDSCIQKCVISSKVFAVLLSTTSDHARKLFSESLVGDRESFMNHQEILPKGYLDKLSRFCVYLLDKLILDSDFSWEDTVSLRIYFPTSLAMNMDVVLLAFKSAFDELAKSSQRFEAGMESIFNVVPVLAAGRSATMENIFTCELLATKS